MLSIKGVGFATDLKCPDCGETLHIKVGKNGPFLACNGYLDKLEPRAAGRIMPINNYMLATEPLDEATARRLIREDTSMSDSLFVINYWKLWADNRLLFGGGESYTRRFPADIPGFVRKYMLRIYPELADTAIDYAWGGTIGVPLHRVPRIGRVAPNVFYSQDYSGHGVNVTHLAGEIMAAYRGEGSAMQTRENVHRMAEANKAFAHFAW